MSEDTHPRGGHLLRTVVRPHRVLWPNHFRQLLSLFLCEGTLSVWYVSLSLGARLGTYAAVKSRVSTLLYLYHYYGWLGFVQDEYL